MFGNPNNLYQGAYEDICKEISSKHALYELIINADIPGLELGTFNAFFWQYVNFDNSEAIYMCIYYYYIYTQKNLVEESYTHGMYPNQDEKHVAYLKNLLVKLIREKTKQHKAKVIIEAYIEHIRARGIIDTKISFYPTHGWNMHSVVNMITAYNKNTGGSEKELNRMLRNPEYTTYVYAEIWSKDTLFQLIKDIPGLELGDSDRSKFIQKCLNVPNNLLIQYLVLNAAWFRCTSQQQKDDYYTLLQNDVSDNDHIAYIRSMIKDNNNTCVMERSLKTEKMYEKIGANYALFINIKRARFVVTDDIEYQEFIQETIDLPSGNIIYQTVVVPWQTLFNLTYTYDYTTYTDDASHIIYLQNVDPIRKFLAHVTIQNKSPTCATNAALNTMLMSPLVCDTLLKIYKNSYPYERRHKSPDNSSCPSKNNMKQYVSYMMGILFSSNKSQRDRLNREIQMDKTGDNNVMWDMGHSVIPELTLDAESDKLTTDRDNIICSIVTNTFSQPGYANYANILFLQSVDPIICQNMTYKDGDTSPKFIDIANSTLPKVYPLNALIVVVFNYRQSPSHIPQTLETFKNYIDGAASFEFQSMQISILSRSHGVAIGKCENVYIQYNSWNTVIHLTPAEFEAIDMSTVHYALYARHGADGGQPAHPHHTVYELLLRAMSRLL